MGLNVTIDNLRWPIVRPKVTNSYSRVTYSDPNVTYSEPKVTFSDPKMTYSYPRVTLSHPKVTLHTSPNLYLPHLSTAWPLVKVVVVGGDQL